VTEKLPTHDPLKWLVSVPQGIFPHSLRLASSTRGLPVSSLCSVDDLAVDGHLGRGPSVLRSLSRGIRPPLRATWDLVARWGLWAGVCGLFAGSALGWPLVGTGGGNSMAAAWAMGRQGQVEQEHGEEEQGEEAVANVEQEAATPDEPTLEDRWRDYLLSDVNEADRKWALAAMTDDERAEMDTVLARSRFKLDPIAAQVYIKRLCEMGPRISGSKSMRVQQAALVKYFSGLGMTVASQSFDVPHPETRINTTLTNLIVQIHPERKRRILICCHYDTRPYADRDLVDPKASMDGANDGASGVGLLMVLAPHLKAVGPRLGVDLVFFDAEELVYIRERDTLFLGSTHFAKQYVQSPPEHRYVAGVLLDMIADRTLDLYYEKNSLHYAGPLTKQIWQKARVLEIDDFVSRPLHLVRDDHLPLNEIAKIPTTDLIDFDYPSIDAERSYWHTTEDTVDKCSPLSMAKVGIVILEWAKDYTK
jgi:glutaminyl-peptide cyclotransferase